MAVVIRMKRTGRRNRPCYRISVADSQFPTDGRVLENLGLYDPVSRVEENQVKVNVERARHWLKLGAKPSRTVESILKKHGAYEGMPEKSKRDRSARDKDTAGKRARAERNERFKKAKAERRAKTLAAKHERRRAAKAAAAEEGDE